MFQCKTRASAVALLTLGGGLVAATPALVAPNEAAAIEVHWRNRTKDQRGIILQRNKTKEPRGIIINYKRPRQK